MDALSGSGSMGGNCGESKAWANNYDTAVADAISMTEALINAMGNYADILQQLGYNWALADYEAGSRRAAPVETAPFLPAWSACRVPPPAACGPGSGIFDDVGFAVQALAKFGVEMPDGEPDKLQIAADTWAKFASESGVGNLPTLLEDLARSFDGETAPELKHVDDDIRDLKASAIAVLALYDDLAQSCRNHQGAITAFRDKMKQLLQDLAWDLAGEVATTVFFSVVAGALTAGMGTAAVAAAKAGKLAAKMKTYVDRVLDIKAAVRFVAKVVDNAGELESQRTRLQRIANLFRVRGNYSRALMTGGRIGPSPKSLIERWSTWADKAYDFIRGDTLDVASIAENTGLSVSDIEKIKQHVFLSEHKMVDVYTGEVRTARFDADPDMAEAWMRLSDGRGTATDR
ncbi:hypothetical protein ACFWPJ_04815, partial [Nocardia sp. NPDC058497]